MARAACKADLLKNARENFEKLRIFTENMTEKERSTPFDFSSDTRKKEAHWRRDKNLRDVYIHLYEWHQLLLNWIKANENGEDAPFIPKPYTWKNYGEMNLAFFQKHQGTKEEEAKTMFQTSHKAVMTLAEHFSDAQLFTKDAFPWVGGSTLGSYFVSVTASHYDWALKKLKAHKKNCAV